MKLLGFIVDLARDPEFKQRYEQNPDQVAQEAGLTAKEKEALIAAVPHKLLRLIAEEIPRSIPLLLGPCPANSNFELTEVTPSECLQGATAEVHIVAKKIAPRRNPPAGPLPAGVPHDEFITCWLKHEVTGQIIPGERVSGPDGLGEEPRRGRVRFVVPQNAATGQYELVISAITIMVSRSSAFTVRAGAPLIAGLQESGVQH